MIPEDQMVNVLCGKEKSTDERTPRSTLDLDAKQHGACMALRAIE